MVGGRSGQGKTTLVIQLIKKCFLKDVQRCFVACPTWYSQRMFHSLRKIPGAFPDKYCFTEVVDSVFEYVWQQCNKFRAPTLLFVDDAGAEASIHKGNKGAFARLCINSRHLNLTIIGIVQRFTLVTPSFRDNCEAIISFIPTKDDDVDLIAREFNPSPGHKDGRLEAKRYLLQAWTSRDMFCFIYRPPRNPKIYFYNGLHTRLN